MVTCLPGHCPHHPARSGGALCGGPVQGCRPVQHTCEMDDSDSKGYPIATKNLWGYGVLPLN